MEEEVHRLLEGSAISKVKKDVNDALQKAKEAGWVGRCVFVPWE